MLTQSSQEDNIICGGISLPLLGVIKGMHVLTGVTFFGMCATVCNGGSICSVGHAFVCVVHTLQVFQWPWVHCGWEMVRRFPEIIPH